MMSQKSVFLVRYVNHRVFFTAVIDVDSLQKTFRLLYLYHRSLKVLRFLSLRLAVEDTDRGAVAVGNGGMFGSSFGTPTINPPSSACTASFTDRWQGEKGVTGTDVTVSTA